MTNAIHVFCGRSRSTGVDPAAESDASGHSCGGGGIEVEIGRGDGGDGGGKFWNDVGARLVHVIRVRSDSSDPAGPHPAAGGDNAAGRGASIGGLSSPAAVAVIEVAIGRGGGGVGGVEIWNRVAV